jgi:uncharacterized protein YbbK (DUF523 family)
MYNQLGISQVDDTRKLKDNQTGHKLTEYIFEGSKVKLNIAGHNNLHYMILKVTNKK